MGHNIKCKQSASERFGVRVFNRAAMQRSLPKEVFQNVVQAMDGTTKLRPEFADQIALAMKEWACALGATHYCHWFQPLTGNSAEKHDAFIEWDAPDNVIEKFTGKQLIQGEPDASSFPSGGLRSTYEARGYTGWDPSSPAFLWRAGDGLTLCIPSVYFSWTGDVLDTKIPLLRSEKALKEVVLRLLDLTKVKATHIYSTLGLEQEYFVIDRELRNQRPDLLLLGRTVVGAPSPKGQELQDHYFGAVKDRILSYMQDFENSALELGIPIKTRHNEVAPAQHEIAPNFERASVAIDHNILLMEAMRQVAVHHGLACLLHEKPFAGLNGSGKHTNWSICTDTGINLLDPSETPENNLHFLVILAAILQAVHRHASLLRASIGSASNDYRLGGHEAPPAIISVYLGRELEEVLTQIEESGSFKRTAKQIKEGFPLLDLPHLAKDNTDRNRTSPMAFTGNKFEFRAVGSSANPAFPVTVLNAIVAESLNELLHAAEKQIKQGVSTAEALFKTVRESLKHSKPIRFSGDNYSAEWTKEAKKRGLPNHEKSVEAFKAMQAPATVKAFKNILTGEELKSRYEIALENYAATEQIQANLLLDIFNNQILPVAVRFQKNLAKSIAAVQEVAGKRHTKGQLAHLNRVSETIEQAIEAAAKLDEQCEKLKAKPLEKRAIAFSKEVGEAGDVLRRLIDRLETWVEDGEWPLPKYRELLFSL